MLTMLLIRPCTLVDRVYFSGKGSDPFHNLFNVDGQQLAVPDNNPAINDDVVYIRRHGGINKMGNRVE